MCADLLGVACQALNVRAPSPAVCILLSLCFCRVRVSLGRIGPEYASLELNIGGSVVSSALCDVCGVSRSQLREMYRQYGDLGDVAQASHED